MGEFNFQEWSNTDEGKEAMTAILPELAKQAGYISQEEVQGLVKNKDEILGQLTNAKEDSKLLKKTFDLLGVKDKLELDKLIAKRNNPNASEGELGLLEKLSSFEAQSQRLQEDLEGAKGKVSAANQRILELSAKSEITKALIAEGENEHRAELLATSLMSQAKFSLTDDYGVKSENGLSPKEWFERWKDGDQGKSVLSAQQNSGGNFNPGKPTNISEKQQLIKQRNELVQQGTANALAKADELTSKINSLK